MRSMDVAKLVCVAIVAFSACSAADRALERRISAEARRPEGTVLAISALTEFHWDRLHIFGPYTSQETIDRELGFSRADAVFTVESDASRRRVFRRSRRVPGQ